MKKMQNLLKTIKDFDKITLLKNEQANKLIIIYKNLREFGTNKIIYEIVI